MDSPVHPLMKFKRSTKQTWRALAEQCQEAGWQTSENSLVQIGTGYTRPSFERCSWIAVNLLGKPALALPLYRFPYKRLKAA